jgi:tetratricopeptide (TPR) repeat protein
VAPTAARETAEEALRVAEADPERADELAVRALGLARHPADAAATVIAERARGLAAIHHKDLDSALRHLRRAVGLARTAALPRLGGEAQMTLAYALNMRGRPRDALREIRSAVQRLDHVEGARARAQEGAILHQLGKLDEALARYREALPPLRRARDDLWVQRVLFNRGVLHAQRHEHAAALADLDEAVRLCRALGLHLQIGYALANLGFVQSLRGEVPAALRHFDEAEQIIQGLGAQLGPLLTDRTDLLLSAWLIAEARDTAERAVTEFDRTRSRLGLPEVRLLLARAAAVDGDLALALAQARRAAREFVRQDRSDWAALARLTVLAIRERSGSAPAPSLAAVERAVETVPAPRWPLPALEGRLLAARVARATGRPDTAGRHLVIAAEARRRGPALLRARGWYAEASRRLIGGDPGGATRAVRAGLAVLGDHAATVGATDLRAYAAGHRTDLVRLGMEVAVDHGHPEAMWEWAELGRGVHLLHRPVRPPDDDVLAADLAGLRSVALEIFQLRKAGKPVAALVHRQVALERKIRDHVRRSRRPATARSALVPSAATVAGRLGGRALIEFIEHGGHLHAVTMTAAGMRRHRLAPIDEVLDLVRRLPFGLGRLALAGTGRDDRAAALALVRDAAGRLDRLILRPLAETAGCPLVVLPTGPLQSLPWALLPSCAGRPVIIAPSAMLWARAAAQEPTRGGHAAVCAGPDLPGAEAEAMAVAQLHGGKPLLGPSATVSAVTDRLDGAALAHLAAHGTAHHHNPLFSSLRFADGPLMIYDLELLDRVPHTVVLAACESARSVVTAGNELLGLSATFISLGAAQVVASVLPVLDAQTAPLMSALHRRMAAGEPVAEALAEAQRETGGDDRVMAMASGFVCIGSGGPAATSPQVR